MLAGLATIKVNRTLKSTFVCFSNLLVIQPMSIAVILAS